MAWLVGEDAGAAVDGTGGMTVNRSAHYGPGQPTVTVVLQADKAGLVTSCSLPAHLVLIPVSSGPVLSAGAWGLTCFLSDSGGHP